MCRSLVRSKDISSFYLIIHFYNFRKVMFVQSVEIHRLNHSNQDLSIHHPEDLQIEQQTVLETLTRDKIILIVILKVRHLSVHRDTCYISYKLLICVCVCVKLFIMKFIRYENKNLQNIYFFPS
jgi:hypothetical protein